MAAIDAEILIIGAGLAGAATAYHLRRRDAGRVLIVEQEAGPGVHSSGRNAAIIRDIYVEPESAPLLKEGADFIRSRRLARFEQVGLMLIGLGDEEINPRLPRAHGSGLWCADSGVVDVAGLLAAYLAGTEVRFDTTVTRWRRRDDVVRVETNNGELTCGLLVNAAGPWAGALGGLPLTPLNRTLFSTPPLDWVDPSWPCVWHVQEGLYFRPESGGLLLSVCDERPAEPGDYQEEPAVLEQLAMKLAALQPELSEIAIRTQWVGQRTFAPDHRFVIGFDPREPLLFHVAGLGGHGVSASYAVGRYAADLILGGPTNGPSGHAPSRLPLAASPQDWGA